MKALNVYDLVGARKDMSSASYRRLRVALAYTAVFIVTALIAFLPLFLSNKGFINQIDGLRQQYGNFLDTGKTVRQIVSRLLEGKGLSIPAYDFSLGYGGERSWSCDPLVYASVLCPTAYSEQLFNALVLVHLWLTGLCVLPLSHRLGMGDVAAVLTAITYTFSGSGLNCMLQTTLLPTMAIFPLLVDGAIQLVLQRRPWRYITWSFFMCLIGGVYQLYVAQLLIAVLVAAMLIVRRAQLKEWLQLLPLFLGSIAFSMGMASVRMGRIAGIASLDRVSVEYTNPVLYSARYYQRVFSGLIGAMFGGRDWFIGYGAAGLLGVIILWIDESDRLATTCKLLFVTGIVFLSVPFFGKAFNGFTYTANRWVFGFALLIACIVGLELPKLSKLNRMQLIICASVCVCCFGICTLMPYAYRVGPNLQFFGCLIVLAIAWVKRDYLKRVRTVAIILTPIVFLAVNYAAFISPGGSNWQRRMVSNGDAYALLADETPAGLAAQASFAEVSRSDQTIELAKDVKTPGLLAHRILDTQGIDYYASVYNNAVDQFHRELALAGSDIPSVYSTLDQRAALMRLLGVGAYVTFKGHTLPLPYGVSAKAEKRLSSRDGNIYLLYREKNPSSIALLFKDVVSQTTYNALTPLQKQECLLEGVVLSDDEISEDMQVVNPESTSTTVPYSIGLTKGRIEVNDKKIIVGRGGGRFRLDFERDVDQCELYLFVRGLSYDPSSPRERYTDEEWDELTEEEQKTVREREGKWSEPSSYRIAVRSGHSKGKATIFTPAFHLYGGKDTWLWNIGYAKEGRSSVTIGFSSAGVYEFDSFEVLAQPMASYDDATKRLCSREVSNLRLENDTVSADVVAEKNGEVLFFSIPYSTGWNARVDGAPADLMVADTAFMAIRLPEGKHLVELEFRAKTPWTHYLGFAMQSIFLCAFLLARRFDLGGNRVAAEPLFE